MVGHLILPLCFGFGIQPTALEIIHEQDIIPLPAFGFMAGGQDILRLFGVRFGVTQCLGNRFNAPLLLFHDSDQRRETLSQRGLRIFGEMMPVIEKTQFRMFGKFTFIEASHSFHEIHNLARTANHMNPLPGQNRLNSGLEQSGIAAKQDRMDIIHGIIQHLAIGTFPGQQIRRTHQS